MTKINFTTHPSLRYITKSFSPNERDFFSELANQNIPIDYSTCKILADELTASFSIYKDRFINTIDNCAVSLIDTIMQASLSFQKAGLPEIYRNDNPVVSGTLITGLLTIYYHIENLDEENVVAGKKVFGHDHNNFVVAVFHQDGLLSYSASYSHIDIDGKLHNHNCNFADTQMGGDNSFFLKYIMSYLIFKEYAEVKSIEYKSERISSPKKRNKAKFNNTPFDINYITSAWFTNIVKSNSFSVRGHWRLQPFGPNRTKKKLIWIDEFEKTGYARKAGKEK